MKRIAKRLLSILLVICCLLSIDLTGFTIKASGDDLFTDNFSNASLSGWMKADMGVVSDGIYSITGDGTNLVSSPVSETNYAVQSKVTLKKQSGSELSKAAVIIGSTASATEYYEFGIGVIKSGTTYAFLYKHGTDDEQSKTIYQLTDNIPGTKKGKITANTEYTLTVVMENGVLSCLINGEKFTAADVAVLGNYAGISSTGAVAKFDDFAIKKVGDKQIDSIKLLNTPEEVTVNGSGLDFDIQVVYSGVYGIETISSSANGVSITGFDGKAGKKTFTVSYGGKSATFTANVVAEPEKTVLFKDTFDKSLDVDKWSLTELTTKNGYNFNYQFKCSSGNVLVEFPKNIGDYTNVITAKADLDNSLLGSVKNYSVEMDATIIKNSTVEGARAADAALDIASGQGTFSFRVRGNGTVILYQSTTIVAQASISDFKLGKKFSMKAEVYDGVVLCYYNDKCVLKYQSEDLMTSRRKVDVGFRAVNGTVQFDNFVVKELPNRSVWAATKLTIDDLENGTKDITTLQANSIDYGRYLVNLHYADGSVTPVAFSASMITGYQDSSKQQQKITFQYGPFTKTLTYKYTATIFSDSFASGAKSDWKDISSKYKGYITLNYNNGIQIECVSDSLSHDVGQFVKLFANYPNVKVSADVSLKSIKNAKERRVGVRTRYESGSCYEWMLSYEPTEATFYLVLYRVNSGTRVELKNYTEGMILERTGLEDIYMGTSYNVAIECIDNQLFLYFNNKLIDVYADESEDVILSGAGAGWRAVNTSGTVANFRVDEAAARKVKSIVIPQVEGTLEMYQGFTFSPYDYSLHVTYSDGTVADLALTADMIGEFDNTTPGKTEVPITIWGQTVYVPVNIVARPEYIENFIKLVRDCKKAKKVTLEDKEDIDELEEIYQSLSGYEISTIDEKVIEKYHDLIEALYKLEHPELAEYDMVYSDDFNGELIEADWNTNGSSARGTWTTVNGVLVNEQERYGWNDKISYIDYSSFYGDVYSVEADVMMTNAYGCYVSILSNVSELGYYHARITNEYKGSDGKQTYMVQLYKSTSSHKKLDETYVELKGIEMDVNEWHNLRLTNMDGVLTVYLDGILVLSYDDSGSSTCLTTGTFGFRSLYGDMRYDSLRVMGTKISEGEAYVPQIEPTYYKDDFEDEVAGANPSHWVEVSDVDKWKVYKKNNSLVYGTTSKELTYSWLHTFESDPTITMDFMVENTAKSGRIEFLTRYTQAVYSYAGIGYDFTQSKWYIYCARGEDFKPKTTYAKDTYDLKAGEWYSIKIEEDVSSIKVYINDKLVMEETNAYMTGYGRIGVLSENANLYIDNVSYTMPHGGNVDDGVMEFIFDDGVFGRLSHLEIESLGGNTLIGVNEENQFISKDNGATWVATDEYPDVQGRGLGYPSILELSEGVFIMVYADTYEVYKSTDYMKTWTKIGQIIPDIGENMSAYGDWENLIHVNALTKVTLDDGTERIFLPVGMRRYDEIGRLSRGHYTRIYYSDDGGATWEESENDTRDITPNYVEDYDEFFSWTESKVIKCADGSLRMYNTRQYDCLTYAESHDGGVTWTEFGSVPYVQNGQTSYSIVEDPENTGIYYMVCINSKATSYNSMQPRNRLSLLKTTDGKNWEFVTDIERFTSFSSHINAELYQIIDPSISIIDGYMYVTMGRSYQGDTTAHGAQSVFLVRLEMDKLTKTSDWDDSNIADPTRPEIIEIEELPQTIFGVSDLFVVYGGKLKLTAFNGNVTYEDLSELTLVGREPNMYAKGTYNVTMMNLYAQFVSYDIEVTDNYNITWNIVGKGEVTPYYAKIAKGLERTFTAVPEDGWRVDKVLINGEKVKVKDNQFSVTGSEDITIDVIFTDKVSDGTIWIATIAGTLIVGGIIAIYIFKKEWLIAIKNKMKEVIKWKR